MSACFFFLLPSPKFYSHLPYHWVAPSEMDPRNGVRTEGSTYRKKTEQGMRHIFGFAPSLTPSLLKPPRFLFDLQSVATVLCHRPTFWPSD